MLSPLSALPTATLTNGSLVDPTLSALKPRFGILPRTSRIHSPFAAAMLFYQFCQPEPKGGYAAYVCYLQGNKPVGMERIGRIRGYNPTLKLDSVIKQAPRLGADGIILATWHQPTGEERFALEQSQEVERQFDVLEEGGIRLVDNLRISETGLFSYYAHWDGPFDTPGLRPSGANSVNRLYQPA